MTVAGGSVTLDVPALHAAVFAWFDVQARVFAFRATRDPWAILVSEFMAQQTQISRVVARWPAFMAEFPTAEAMAAATPADVLRAWHGIGYNRRALNLWRAARAIVEEHGGQVPRDVEQLLRLPGVGPYSARAVAAIAFGQPVGAVDTNVRRVLGRLAGGADGLAESDLQALADAIVPADRPGEWTQAVMDVGATFCRPRPDCPACPARSLCRYAAAPAEQTTRERTRPEARFETTTRWLRGRILDQLRSAGDGSWTAIADPLGPHDAEAITAALSAMAREGLVELDPIVPRSARLPLG